LAENRKKRHEANIDKGKPEQEVKSCRMELSKKGQKRQGSTATAWRHKSLIGHCRKITTTLEKGKRLQLWASQLQKETDDLVQNLAAGRYQINVLKPEYRGHHIKGTLDGSEKNKNQNYRTATHDNKKKGSKGGIKNLFDVK